MLGKIELTEGGFSLKKKYKHILVDIDNTLTTLQPTLDSMATYLNARNITEDDVLSFRLIDNFNVDNRNLEQSFWRDEEEENSRLAELAQDRVKTFYKNYVSEDTKIHIVTARKDHLFDVTERWLKESGLAYDTFHCIGAQCKLDWLDKHMPEIDAILEDNPFIFRKAYEKGYDKRIDFFKVEYKYNYHCPSHFSLDKETGNEVIH